MCINRCKGVHTHRDILILPSEVSSTLGLQTLKRQKPKPFNPKLKRPQTVKPEVRKTIAPKSREAPWAILRTDPATTPNPQPLKPYKP